MVRYKSRINSVHRLRGETKTRHGLTRLDKNERVTAFPNDFFAQLLADVTADHLCAYPETEALYERLAQQHDVDVENLMITAGSDAGIRHCFELFVNPGGEVVVIEPTFAMVDVYCRLYGAQKQAIGYDHHLELDLERLIASIGPRTELVIIANPNSPTGTLIPEDGLKKVLDRAAEFQVPVLVDEAYYGFCKQTALPLLAEHDNLIVSRTFSKAYGLAGLRVGYLLAQSGLAQLLYRFRPMYEVNSIGIMAAMRILDNPEVVEKYIAETEEGRKCLLEFVKGRGMDFRDTKTNFFHIDFGSKKQAVMDEFSRSGILIRGGLPLDGYETYLRVTLGPPDVIQTLIAAMLRVGLCD